MLNTKLDQDKKRFAKWRAHRKHRQPIPEDLWRLACNHIPALGITTVAREFHLNSKRLSNQAIQLRMIHPKQKGQKAFQPEKMAFQEISLNNMFLPPVCAHGLIIESPDGIRVRIEGSLPDPEYVGKLAACLIAR